jgi:hypothetical protein
LAADDESASTGEQKQLYHDANPAISWYMPTNSTQMVYVSAFSGFFCVLGDEIDEKNIRDIVGSDASDGSCLL